MGVAGWDAAAATATGALAAAGTDNGGAAGTVAAGEAAEGAGGAAPAAAAADATVALEGAAAAGATTAEGVTARDSCGCGCPVEVPSVPSFALVDSAGGAAAVVAGLAEADTVAAGAGAAVAFAHVCTCAGAGADMTVGCVACRVDPWAVVPTEAFSVAKVEVEDDVDPAVEGVIKATPPPDNSASVFAAAAEVVGGFNRRHGAAADDPPSIVSSPGFSSFVRFRSDSTGTVADEEAIPWPGDTGIRPISCLVASTLIGSFARSRSTSAGLVEKLGWTDDAPSRLLEGSCMIESFAFGGQETQNVPF